MKLTNQQIEEAYQALRVFNPACPFKTKLRLNRNLRKLSNAREDKEHDRVRLLYSAVSDKSKKIEEKEAVNLSAEEQLRYQPEFEKLMQEEQEVEIHTVEIFDSSQGQKPRDPQHAIDMNDAKVPNDILFRLLDIVLVPADDSPGQQLAQTE